MIIDIQGAAARKMSRRLLIGRHACDHGARSHQVRGVYDDWLELISLILVVIAANTWVDVRQSATTLYITHYIK